MLCGLWCVGCGLWCAVCGLRFAICGCGLWVVVCVESAQLYLYELGEQSYAVELSHVHPAVPLSRVVLVQVELPS